MKKTSAHRITLAAVALVLAACQDMPKSGDKTTTTEPVVPQISESSLRERAQAQLAAGVKQYDAGEFDAAVKSLGRIPRARPPLEGGAGARAEVPRLLPLRFGPRDPLPRRVPQGLRDLPRLRAHGGRGRPPDLGPGVPQRAHAAHHRARGGAEEARLPDAARQGRADARRRRGEVRLRRLSRGPQAPRGFREGRAQGLRRTRCAR
jgi:hypothetical protein